MNTAIQTEPTTFDAPVLEDETLEKTLDGITVNFFETDEELEEALTASGAIIEEIII